jgi:hypothetical protein
MAEYKSIRESSIRLKEKLRMKENKIIYQDDKILKFIVESKKYGDKEVIIDIKNWGSIKKYRWYLHYEPKLHYSNVYTFINKKTVKLHRFILNLQDSFFIVDHINHNTFDNRENNLRKCSHLENNKNQKIHKDNASGFKGVVWREPRKKFTAQICVNNKIIYLGGFASKIDAAKAYNDAALKYHGKFALLNEV